MAAAGEASRRTDEEMTESAERDGRRTEEVTENDFLCYLRGVMDSQGLVRRAIQSFDTFMDEGLDRIRQQFRIDSTVVDERNQTEADRNRTSIHIEAEFTQIEVDTPRLTVFPLGRQVPMQPNQARLSNLTYAGPLILAARVRLTAHYASGYEETREAEIPPYQVSEFPVMYGSSRCLTRDLPREARKEMGEDPQDVGGYFILNGVEYLVRMLENVRFNMLHCHLALLPSEQVRGEFISQPGGPFENSSQIVIRHKTDGSITIEINSPKFARRQSGTGRMRVQIPFYILFRALGMSSDRQIAEQVAFDLRRTDPVTTHILKALDVAFQKRDPEFEPIQHTLAKEPIVGFLAERLLEFVESTAYRSNEEAVKHLNQKMLGILDEAVLPHIGQSEALRIDKLRFLGLLMHKMFLVEMGISPPTDRDSYSTKRVHDSGVTLPKAFKTLFNHATVQPIIRSLRNLVIATPFEEIQPSQIVHAFRSPTTETGSTLGRTLVQAIVNGGDRDLVIRRRTIRSRIASTVLERKTPGSAAVDLRSIDVPGATSAAKQTRRADEMRRVHPTFLGYICPGQSADSGVKVGMLRQLALTATLCTAGDPYSLKQMLREDPDLQLPSQVTNAEIVRRRLGRVYVDGEWVGCGRIPTHRLAAKYRQLRLAGKVGHQVTIRWDPISDDLEFWLDVGRITRPLLRVVNNNEEYDRACRQGKPIRFEQRLLFTADHARRLARGEIDLEDLVREGVCEYITPEEMENCIVAMDYPTLQAAAHDVTQPFTHCDTPQAILGLVSLISPYANHTQPARITLETNQAKQTCGWYCLSYPFRAGETNRFFQFYVEHPTVSTLTYDFLMPNGLMTVQAHMLQGGDNQEDSVIVSEGFVARGGFEGSFYRTVDVTRERGKNEQFRTPDPATTADLKPSATYRKLVDGVVPVGTRVTTGDVLVGKVVPAEAGSEYAYLDRSHVYQYEEPAVVEAVWQPRGPEDDVFVRVKLRYARPPRIGAKLSSRQGNKCIVANIMSTADMPYTAEGLRPDLIINPHSTPSRMTVGQMIEGAVSNICAREGRIADGTAFRAVDVADLQRRLAASGQRFTGLSRLYDGRTGRWLDVAIFVGLTYQQRLQKFVSDNRYAVGGSGPTDALTGQPLEGKKVHGGMRLGEMEGWVLQAQGAMMTIAEKFRNDADGRVDYVCRGCGKRAAYNRAMAVYSCRICNEKADIVALQSRKASVVFQQEVAAMGVDLSLKMEPRTFERQ